MILLVLQDHFCCGVDKALKGHRSRENSQTMGVIRLEKNRRQPSYSKPVYSDREHTLLACAQGEEGPPV